MGLRVCTIPTWCSTQSLPYIDLQLYLRAWSDSNGRHIGAWIGGYAALSVAQLIAMWVLPPEYFVSWELTLDQGDDAMATISNSYWVGIHTDS